jgi:CDP-diacylglycerol---glycerol-3-phosphate 3-phosphatidyltransferase
MAVHRLGIHPDTITIVGLVVVAVGSVFIGLGAIQLGGVLLVISLPLDALDGAVARAMQRKDRFGAVLDSTLDRYADGFIFGGLAYYFATIDQAGNLLLALAALMGSFVVSYTRARAGEADLSVKIGLFSRFERVIALLVALLIPPLLIPALWALAIGTNLTGLQRLWYVYKHLDRGD